MKNKKMKKYKFLNIWIYTWLFFPFILSVIILIYRAITTKGDEYMSGELWGFCGAIVTAIITLIGVIIGVSVKRPKVKNTDEIKSDTEKINNKIGKNDNKTLYGQNDEIIKFLNDNLKDKDSTILEVLGNVNKYVLEEEIKKNLLGNERDYLKLIELERAKDKTIIDQNNKLINNLISDKSKLIHKNKELTEKNNILIKKINDLEYNLDKDFNRCKL